MRLESRTSKGLKRTTRQIFRRIPVSIVESVNDRYKVNIRRIETRNTQKSKYFIRIIITVEPR